MTTKNKTQVVPVALTMTSREIAELTGKRHDNVLRDIRIMIEQLSVNSSLRWHCESITYVDAQGKSREQYRLDKDTTLTLISGYDAAIRFKIIKRWQALEANTSVPQQSELSNWERVREEGKVVRNQYTRTLQTHGVTGAGYAQCTDSLYKGLFGETAKEIKESHGLKKSANLRDLMHEIALTGVKLTELVSAHYIEHDDINGNLPCANTTYSTGKAVGAALPPKIGVLQQQLSKL